MVSLWLKNLLSEVHKLLKLFLNDPSRYSISWKIFLNTPLYQIIPTFNYDTEKAQ